MAINVLLALCSVFIFPGINLLKKYSVVMLMRIAIVAVLLTFIIKANINQITTIILSAVLSFFLFQIFEVLYITKHKVI